MSNSKPMSSKRGKEILAQAMQDGRTVLEFTQKGGEHVVLDITEHVEQLERQLE